MNASNLRTVEKKVLGAMLMLSDNQMVVDVPMKDIATTMGYKETGGALSWAIQALEMKNFITKTDKEYTITL